MTEQEKITEKVARHHFEALQSRNVDLVLSDFADDCIILCNLAEQPLKGLDQLRALVEGSLQLLTPEVVKQFELKSISVSGEVALVTYSFGNVIPFGTDTYVVKNGKIAIETAVVQLQQG